MDRQQAHTVFSQVPGAMRALTKRASDLESENEQLRAENTQLQLEKRAGALAAKMAKKGLIAEDDVVTKTAELLADPDKLSTKEEAIGMAVGDVPFFELGDGEEKVAGAGKTQLEAFILDED